MIPRFPILSLLRMPYYGCHQAGAIVFLVYAAFLVFGCWVLHGARAASPATTPATTTRESHATQPEEAEGIGPLDDEPEPPESPDESSLDAQELLERAIQRLESRFSLAAQVRFQVDLFGHEMVGSGVYLEQRAKRIPQIRFEMTLQMGDQSSSLLRVCDGRYLWAFRQLNDDGTLQRIDVLRLVNELGPETTALLTPSAESPVLSGPAGSLGGLAGCLRNLAADFRFNKGPDRTLKDTAMWSLEGRWTRERLLALLPEQTEAIERGLPADTAPLAPHLPDRVVLWLGKDDLFPYRIEYARQRPRDGGAARSQVVMQWFEVAFDTEIDPARFRYEPPETLKYSDQTQAILDRLRGKK
jgi:hypothetical protein